MEQINQRRNRLQKQINYRLAMRSCLFFHAALVLVLLSGAGCAALNSSSEADIAKTWTHARVYLPNVPSYVRPADVSVAQKLPTVVLLHGCTGLTAGIARWARTLTSAGYGVVSPDSFARSYRWSNCDPKTYLGGAFPSAGMMRRRRDRIRPQDFASRAMGGRTKSFLDGT